MVRNSLCVFNVAKYLGSVIALEVRNLFWSYQKHLN